MIEWLNLLEILRDFTQLLRIITLGLGVHIGPAVRYTFVVISDVLSLDFTLNFGIPFSIMFYVHFAWFLVCEIYIISASIIDKKKIAQVRGMGSTSQEILDRKMRKICDTIVMFIMSSVFMPLLDESLRIFISTNEILEKDTSLQSQIFGGISIFMLIILNPILLVRGIRMNRDLQTQFNHNGEMATYDVEHQPQSIKQQNIDYKNFAAMSNQYNFNGSYHKLFVMIYKAMLILTFQFQLHQSSNLVGFICQYGFAFIQFGIFIHYVIKTQPYHDYRENRLLLLSQIAVLLCSMVNFGLLWVDDEKGENHKMQTVFSVIQFFICFLLFMLYLFKILIYKTSCLSSITKSVLEEFDFTSINERGIFSFAGLRNRYSNYLYFNENYYEKDKEVLLNVWQPFWLKLMQQDQDFRIKRNHEMKFVNLGPKSPPFLSNFAGSVQERFEENIRIMQKIGRDEYIKELASLHAKDNTYQQLILSCLNCLPGVDVYYNYTNKFKNLPQRKSYFCRVTVVYFPLTLVLQYDDEGVLKQSSFSNPPLELSGEELLKDIWEQNQSESIMKQRRIRRILRSLSGKTVNFNYALNVKHMKFRETNGFKEDYYCDAVVTYKSGTFKYEPLQSVNIKLSSGQTIDIGSGFSCSLEYNQADGVDIDGEKFTYYRKLQLDDSFFGIIDDSGEISTVLADIITNNRVIWKDEVTKMESLYKQYRDDIVRECERRTETLSYDFNISVFACPFQYSQNKSYLENQLLAEKNKQFHTLVVDYPEEFDKLYEKLAYHSKHNFLSYLYFFFYDIWRRNKDLLIVQKNEELLNPDKKECIIYDHTKSIYDWKEVFTKKGLRTRRGKGYFNDKLLKNLCYMISKQSDKPTLFFEKSNSVAVESTILNQSTVKVEETKFVHTKENFNIKDTDIEHNQQKYTLKPSDSIYLNRSTLAFQLQNTIDKSIKQDDALSIQMQNSQALNHLFKRSGMLQFKRYISHPELLNQTLEVRSISNLDESIQC